LPCWAQVGEETQDNRGISPEEIERMTDQNDSAQAKSPEKTAEEKRLMEEWEQHMSDFVPEDITTIVIDPRREVVSIPPSLTRYNLFNP
jgi:hypothetical protein